MTNPLFEHFEATDFIVHAEVGDIVLRHGHTSPALDAWLGATESWVFITAWNPEGRAVSAGENNSAQQRLRDRLGQLGLRFVEAVGRTPQWQEPSLFVLDCSRDQALALGGEFRQAAVVIGTRGNVALVVAC